MTREAGRRTILYFEPVAEVGGAERVLLSLLAHLDRTRFRPLVATIGRGPLHDELSRLGVPVRWFPRHRLSRFPATAAAVFWLAALARRTRAGWIHAQGTKAQIYAGLAARLAGARSLWHRYDPPPPGLGALERLAHALPRDRVIGITPASVEGIPVRDVPIVLPGVEVPPPISPAERAEARAALGLAPGDFVVLNVGRLQAFKGHRHVLAAARRLAGEGVPVRVYIVGGALFGMEPHYPAELDRMVAASGVADRVHRTGYVPEPEVRRLHAAADALVHAALAEPFGLAVAEAMALALPVVAFAAVGPSILVEHGASGLLVPVGDETALAESLLGLARDPSLRSRLGQAARARVACRFTNAAMARAIEAIYEEGSWATYSRR